MPWKEELVVAERLHYLPMQLTACSLQSRNIPKTSLNFLAGGEQTEFTVDLAKLTVFHTRGNWKFRLPPPHPLSLCFKDSL